MTVQCPPRWRPGCTCNPYGLEPSEKCAQHGFGYDPACPYCGQFKSQESTCKRCGYDPAARALSAPRSAAP